MPINKEVPPILGPGEQNPASYSQIYPDHNFVDAYGIHVVQGHYWIRIGATDVPCGDNEFGLKVIYKRGVSQALIVEVASALELTVPPLKTTLSSKIGGSHTVSEERTIEYTRTVKPIPGYAITFAEWHKIFHSVLRRQKYFWGIKARIAEQVVEIGTEHTVPDQIEYPDPKCSLAKIKKDADDGYSEMYTLDFGFMRFAVQGKKTSGGKVALAGIRGRVTPGEVDDSDQLAAYLRSINREPKSSVVLSESLGTVNDFYGWSKKRRNRKSSSLPWLIALGFGSLLAYVIKTNKGQRQYDEYVSDSEFDRPVSKGIEFVGGRRIPRPMKAPEPAKAQQPRAHSNFD